MDKNLSIDALKLIIERTTSSTLLGELEKFNKISSPDGGDTLVINLITDELANRYEAVANAVDAQYAAHGSSAPVGKAAADAARTVIKD